MTPVSKELCNSNILPFIYLGGEMKCNPNIDASVGLGIVWRFSFLFNKRTWVKIPPQVAYGVISAIVASSRFLALC